MFLIETLLLLSVTVVTTRRLTEDNIKYIIVLKDESTAEDVDNVMRRIEQQEQKDSQLMEMESLHNLSPMIVAKISEETASKVSYCIVRNINVLSLLSRQLLQNDSFVLRVFLDLP